MLLVHFGSLSLSLSLSLSRLLPLSLPLSLSLSPSLPFRRCIPMVPLREAAKHLGLWIMIGTFVVHFWGGLGHSKWG